MNFLDVLCRIGRFPRINDTKFWQAHVAKMKMKAAMNVVKALALFGVVGWGCISRGQAGDQ